MFDQEEVNWKRKSDQNDSSANKRHSSEENNGDSGLTFYESNQVFIRLRCKAFSHQLIYLICKSSFINLPEIIHSDRLRRVCKIIHKAAKWTLNSQKYVRKTLAEQHKTRWRLMQESTLTIFWINCQKEGTMDRLLELN